MTTKLLSLFIATIFSGLLNGSVSAQNSFPSTGSAGIGTTAPDASAILEMKSLTQGMLLPRMSAGQRGAIVSPATGLLVYQLKGASGFYYYNGTAWVQLGASSGANLSLSNLTSPTAVNQSLVANANNSFDIGSSNIGWKNLFLTGSVYFANVRGFYTVGTNTAVGLYSLNSDAGSSYNAGTGVYSLYKNTSGSSNTANGYASLYSNTEGSNNTANGFQSLYFNTIGSGNTASGYYSLFNSSVAFYNSAFGSFAGYSNTTGGQNSFFGYSSGSSNTIGSNNTFTGMQSGGANSTGNNNSFYGTVSGISNTTGNDNTFSGYNSGTSNTTGYSNSFYGSNAGFSNVTGNRNVFIGDSSGYSNATGSYNTAVGYQALYANTGSNNTAVGYGALNSSNVDGASNNTAIGFDAGLNTTGGGNLFGGSSAGIKNGIGFNNTFLGSGAGYINTTGNSNTFVGSGSGFGNKTGNNNVFIGQTAGSGNTDGSNNVYIGQGSGGAANISNAVAIGYKAIATKSNTIILGSTSILINVGIGTSNPDPNYKLSVNGSIRAKEIRVETGWSDYVFENNYKLRSLYEVQQYILQNKHLPGIPSAQEIQENGLAVADTQTKMMQKIEELTLYMIELQKEIDQLKAEKK